MDDDRHDEHDEQLAHGQDEELLRLSQGYHQPPPLGQAQRDELWERIQARRNERVPDRSPQRSRARFGRTHRWWWPVAAAALLLLGIGIGHELAPEPGSPTDGLAPAPSVAEAGSATHTSDSADFYRIAALDHLMRSETLLTQFRYASMGPSAGPKPVSSFDSSFGSSPGSSPESSAGSRASSATGGDHQSPLRRWAADLLLQTRLLMSSPAADDAEMNRLLHDLELVLAQIVQLDDDPTGEAGRLIREGLDRRSILLRLRAETPAADVPKGA